MKIFLGVLFLTAAFAGASAEAEEGYVITCGDGRGAAAAHAELAIVDDFSGPTAFYLEGKKLGADDFDIFTENGGWVVTLYASPGKPDRKFVFRQMSKRVQEYKVDGEGGEKKVGSFKPCKWPEDS